jgi:hypothetical protein
MKKILQKIGWYGLNGLIGIEIDGKSDISTVTVTRKDKDEVEIIASQRVDPEEMKTFLASHPYTPIALKIQGFGLVEQYISASSDDPIFDILGVKVDQKKDFLVQFIPAGTDKNWGGLLRKETLENVFFILGSASDRVVYVNFSDLPTVLLIPALDGYSSERIYELSTKQKKYYWQGSISSPREANLKIEADELADRLGIPPDLLGIYSTILYFYLGNTEDIKAMKKVRNQYFLSQKRHHWLRGLKVGIWAVIGLCIIGLGLHLYGQVYANYSQTQIAQNQDLLQKIIENEAYIQHQSAFLESIDQSQMVNSRASFYIDQLAFRVPEPIHLHRLILKPTEKDVKKIDSSLLENDVDIILTGSSQTASAITEFSKTVAALSFIKEAELFQSHFDFQSESHRFILTISLLQP